MHTERSRPAYDPGSARLIAASSWLAVLVIAAALLVIMGYRSRDPDSALYTEISSRMSLVAMNRWIAPEWEGLWDLYGPFREHPIGILVLPALLARAGYPAAQAAFVVGAIASVAALCMLKLAATPVVRRHEGVALQWAALILPIAFVYRVRANQEYPVLVLTLLGLYATHRARRSPAWILVLLLAACGLTLIKGIFVVFLPAVCGLWLWLVPAANDHRADSRPRTDAAAWTGIVLAVIAVLATAWIYETVYRRATGDSFLSFYIHDRIAENAGLDGASSSLNTTGKLYNGVWYLVRVLWFATPGSWVLLWLSRRARAVSFDELRPVYFAVLAAAIYVLAMSLGANRADRFIFPAYFFVGIAGAVVAMRRWTRVQAFAYRLAALPPYALPVAWLLLFILTLVTTPRLPYVKLSPS